jgi:hypothetical protein
MGHGMRRSSGCFRTTNWQRPGRSRLNGSVFSTPAFGLLSQKLQIVQKAPILKHSTPSQSSNSSPFSTHICSDFAQRSPPINRPRSPGLYPSPDSPLVRASRSGLAPGTARTQHRCRSPSLKVERPLFDGRQCLTFLAHRGASRSRCGPRAMRLICSSECGSARFAVGIGHRTITEWDITSEQ